MSPSDDEPAKPEDPARRKCPFLEFLRRLRCIIHHCLLRILHFLHKLPLHALVIIILLVTAIKLMMFLLLCRIIHRLRRPRECRCRDRRDGRCARGCAGGKTCGDKDGDGLFEDDCVKVEGEKKDFVVLKVADGEEKK